MRMSGVLGSLLPRLPAQVLANVIRRRPWLLERMPAGRSIRWPYYQGDLVVHVDPANEIERRMVTGYDPDVCRAVSRFVAPGSNCIDVGANVGAVTLLMAKLVGASGRVLAVEPGPPYVARLRKNLAANPYLLHRVSILMTGVGDEEGTLTWRPDPDHPYNAGLSAVHAESVPNEVIVPVTTVDIAVATEKWTEVAFIKIDVEGMELEVLTGAQEVLRTLRPVVLFETLPSFRFRLRAQLPDLDTFGAISDMLRGLGYRLCELGFDGVLRDVMLDALPENTIAVPKEGSY